MKNFIFRNYTVELFFNKWDIQFSGYEEITFKENTYDRFFWWYLPSYKDNEELVASEIESYSRLFHMAINKIGDDKPIIAFTMRRVFKISYLSSDYTVEKAIELYNNNLILLAEENNNIKVVDIGDFYDEFNRVDLIDWKYFFLSQIPLNPKLVLPFNNWFKRQLKLFELKRKKCLVLDLDNTLWGGILGEDGVDGIKIGEAYPGNTFSFFQKSLIELSKSGIILTICSKNNEADVIEAWAKHPNIILKRSYFATYRINWQNKAENILEIANELNIGLDSMVFIDDNPTERELVRQMLPDVNTPDFPEKEYLIPEFVRFIVDTYFKSYSLTKEDLSKTQQYKDNALRKKSESLFSNFHDYLRSLEINLKIEYLNEISIVRFAQMTQKTNQFNLTTKRYTESDIKSIYNNSGQIYGLRVEDRFGDNGLTGLIIIKFENNITIIDTFLLSCRILGKDIEKVFLLYVLMKLKKQGIIEVEAQYLKTAKNKQVSDFYDKSNFRVINEDEGNKNYVLRLNTINTSTESIYNIIE